MSPEFVNKEAISIFSYFISRVGNTSRSGTGQSLLSHTGFGFVYKTIKI